MTVLEGEQKSWLRCNYTKKEAFCYLTVRESGNFILYFQVFYISFTLYLTFCLTALFLLNYAKNLCVGFFLNKTR